MKQQWSIKLLLYDDELLSSWLVRMALRFGCDPLVLTGEVFDKWRIWTMDTDRVHEADRLKRLSELSGITVPDFQNASLYSIASQIHGQEPPDAVWPWILSLGARNTKRKGGLQYCPTCLSTDKHPYFRKQWRYAWHTGCEVHHCSLLDRCPHCHSPIEPHRLLAEDNFIQLCANCHSDLSDTEPLALNDNALAFQKLVNSLIENGKIEFHQEVLFISQWFELLDFFCAMLRRANRNDAIALGAFLRTLAIDVDSLNLPIVSGASVELLRNQERQQLFVATYQMLKSSLDDFQFAAQQANITRQGFCGKGERLPSVLQSIYDNLPESIISPKKTSKTRLDSPRQKNEVMRMMARLQRKLEFTQR